MADDLGTVARIYAAGDIELDRRTRRGLEQFLADNPRGKHGQVRYDLRRDFGLSPHTVRERFAFYFERFPVQEEDT